MVKFVKLISGEEVVANFEETDSEIILRQPIKMVMHKQGIGMVPWMPFLKEKDPININKSSVMFVAEADQDVINGYNEQFGGIVVPK